MRTNVAASYLSSRFGETHEGASAARLTDEQALRRSVMSCMLWENEFYEDGVEIAKRIADFAGKLAPEKVASIAIEARHVAHLRHVPLLLLKALVKSGRGKMVADAIAETVGRADEITEFLALYWKEGKRPLSAQMKRGLARAFLKFNEYSLAKYNRDSVVKLRDALFLCHAKPDTPEREAMWKRLVNGDLATPDTWEVGLSTGGDKKETFERLIREGKLGYFALLRNLRNMIDADCDLDLVRQAIIARKNGADKVLPFRFVAAARAAPRLEAAIDTALCEGIATLAALKGRTMVVVDVSASMDEKLSAKSDLTRMDAAATLASVIHAEELRVFTFSDKLAEVPARRGMAGVDAIVRSQMHSGTRLGDALHTLKPIIEGADRLIVITDEQSHDAVPSPSCKGYMINVASAKNGVGYGPWMHIDGFSENVIRFISEIESAA